MAAGLVSAARGAGAPVMVAAGLVSAAREAGAPVMVDAGADVVAALFSTAHGP